MHAMLFTLYNRSAGIIGTLDPDTHKVNTASRIVMPCSTLIIKMRTCLSLLYWEHIGALDPYTTRSTVPS
jgi:hypothetical protein